MLTFGSLRIVVDLHTTHNMVPRFQKEPDTVEQLSKAKQVFICSRSSSTIPNLFIFRYVFVDL